LLGVDDGEDTGDRLAEVVARGRKHISTLVPNIPNSLPSTWPFVLPSLWATEKFPSPLHNFPGFENSGGNVHLVELGTRRDNLLDPELTEFGLQLVELLGELILVLVPELAGLDLS
jgi:hypothetical protein